MAEAAAAGGRPRVLITGASGTIGRVLREGLQATHEVLGLDARRGPGADVVADARKLRRIRRHFEGIDVVIDLAAAASSRTQWKVVWKNNIPATVNTLEAARLASVRRVVFASSNHATGFYPTSRELRGDEPVRPDTLYGVTKVYGEALGRLYADKFGLEVACIRIGTFDRRPATTRQLATWLSPGDAVRLFTACLSAPGIGFAVVYGISANTRRYWELEPALALGYRPEDDAERYAGDVQEYQHLLQDGPFTERNVSGWAS